MLDAGGSVTGTRSYANHGNGVYAIYDMAGKVTLRVRNTGPWNAVVIGVFFGGTGAGQGTTPPPAGSAVRFLGKNTATRGTWKGTFGTQGFQVINESASLPAFATVTPASKSDHVWVWNSSDLSALQKGVGPDRLAACWYSPGSFDVKVNLTDGQTHKVTFCSLDWDKLGRSQKVEVLDSSGRVVHATDLSGFQSGAHLSYDLKGSVTVRFTRSGPANSVVSGIFFDAPSAPL